jgi:RNA polymerase-binding transcription factor DksA
MTQVDIGAMRTRLEQERTDIQAQLQERGSKGSDTRDWQGDSGDIKVDSADQNEVADQIEQLVTNVPVVEHLETRLREIEAALERIENGTYGICTVGGEEIPAERLEANPAAATCIEHAPPSL